MPFPRISSDPQVMGGMPCIRGLRFPVASIVAMIADEMTVDEILTEHPSLERDDIAAALHYASSVIRERQFPLLATA